MRIRVSKGVEQDRIEVTRDDGSAVSWTSARTRPVPRDALRHVVERLLASQRGFWARIAAGAEPARAFDAPSDALVQLDCLVQCLESDLWGGRVDADTFRELLSSACTREGVAPLHVTDPQLERLRERILALRDRWLAVAAGDTLELDW